MHRHTYKIQIQINTCMHTMKNETNTIYIYMKYNIFRILRTLKYLCSLYKMNIFKLVSSIKTRICSFWKFINGSIFAKFETGPRILKIRILLSNPVVFFTGIPRVLLKKNKLNICFFSILVNTHDSAFRPLNFLKILGIFYKRQTHARRVSVFL